MTEPTTSAPAARRLLAGTALGRARGRHRALLVATCLAFVLAAVGDEATGYDGPGPFFDLAVALLVAVLWWRYVPLLAVVAGLFFLYGGAVQPDFAHRLLTPAHLLVFTSGWLQQLGFAAGAACAVAAIVTASRSARRS